MINYTVCSRWDPQYQNPTPSHWTVTTAEKQLRTKHQVQNGILGMYRSLNVIHLSEEQSCDQQIFQKCWKVRFYEYKTLGTLLVFSFGCYISWTTIAIYFVLTLPEIPQDTSTTNESPSVMKQNLNMHHSWKSAHAFPVSRARGSLHSSASPKNLRDKCRVLVEGVREFRPCSPSHSFQQ